MTGIKKILFPVDFSQRCEGAARYVESFAGWFEAEILLLHVVDATTYASASEQLCLSRQDRLSDFMVRELKQFTVRRVCTMGDPAEEIVKMARSWEPDLVMMPTYGLGFYRPSLLGSVTAKVLHDVPCPVWTSTHSAEAPPLEKITLSNVLCALDLGQRSEPILEWAASLAKQHAADLGIAHAAPVLATGAGPSLHPQIAGSLAAAAQDRIDALQSAAGTAARVFVSGGEPAKVVACAARDFHADVLVIGRHSGRGEHGHLRHNAYAIIRDSACPVISI